MTRWPGKGPSGFSENLAGIKCMWAGKGSSGQEKVQSHAVPRAEPNGTYHMLERVPYKTCTLTCRMQAQVGIPSCILTTVLTTILFTIGHAIHMSQSRTLGITTGRGA